MVKIKFQPLHPMTSTITHDLFRQEANTLSSLCVLMYNNGRDVTRTSHTSRLSPGSIRDLLIKKVDFDLYTVCFFMDFWGCEGSGVCFERLRMRSRSMRKCAHRNAGDLGSRLAVCACAYDPIHVTAQSKRLGPHCACVQSLCEKCGFNPCVRVFFIPWGHVVFHDHIWALWRQFGHMAYMLDSDWSRKFLLRSDWSGPGVALMTTVLYCFSSSVLF